MSDILTSTADFKKWVTGLKSKIKSVQIKAAISVNSDLLHLYWDLGSQIVEKQIESHWGDKFLTRLSSELLADFPTMRGFSVRNLITIRKWYLFYSQNDEITKQLVAQLSARFFSVPWGHHLYILSQSKSVTEAYFYLIKTLENITQPIGVSSYELSQVLPDHIQSSLPTIEEIEDNMASVIDNDD